MISIMKKYWEYSTKEKPRIWINRILLVFLHGLHEFIWSELFWNLASEIPFSAIMMMSFIVHLLSWFVFFFLLIDDSIFVFLLNADYLDESDEDFETDEEDDEPMKIHWKEDISEAIAKCLLLVWFIVLYSHFINCMLAFDCILVVLLFVDGIYLYDYYMRKLYEEEDEPKE